MLLDTKIFLFSILLLHPDKIQFRKGYFVYEKIFGILEKLAYRASRLLAEKVCYCWWHYNGGCILYSDCFIQHHSCFCLYSSRSDYVYYKRNNENFDKKSDLANYIIFPIYENSDKLMAEILRHLPDSTPIDPALKERYLS